MTSNEIYMNQNARVASWLQPPGLRTSKCLISFTGGPRIAGARRIAKGSTWFHNFGYSLPLSIMDRRPELPSCHLWQSKQKGNVSQQDQGLSRVNLIKNNDYWRGVWSQVQKTDHLCRLWIKTWNSDKPRLDAWMQMVFWNGQALMQKIS